MSPRPAAAQSFDSLSSTQEFSHRRSGSRRPAPLAASRFRNSRSSVRRSPAQKLPDRARGRAAHRHAGRLDRNEIGGQRPRKGRRGEPHRRNARLARHLAVVLDGRREHADELGIGREGGARNGEPAGPIGIVGIEERDDLGPRRLEPEIAGAAWPEIVLGQDDANARIGEARQVGARAVGRGVVDDDQFEAGAFLCQHARDRARQRGGAIVGRDDDRNVGQVGQVEGRAS